MKTNIRLWMYTLNGTVWYLFCLVWSSISFLRMHTSPCIGLASFPGFVQGRRKESLVHTVRACAKFPWYPTLPRLCNSTECSCPVQWLSTWLLGSALCMEGTVVLHGVETISITRFIWDYLCCLVELSFVVICVLFVCLPYPLGQCNDNLWTFVQIRVPGEPGNEATLAQPQKALASFPGSPGTRICIARRAWYLLYVSMTSAK